MFPLHRCTEPVYSRGKTDLECSRRFSLRSNREQVRSWFFDSPWIAYILGGASPVTPWYPALSPQATTRPLATGLLTKIAESLYISISGKKMSLSMRVYPTASISSVIFNSLAKWNVDCRTNL
jgi:hypothetical protein